MQRNTKQRQRIKDVIVGKKVHMSAKQVYDCVNADQETISLATVYRTLNALVQNNELSYFTSVNNEVIYDGTLIPHAHFICKDCHEIIDLSDLDDIIKKISEQKYNLDVEQLSVTLIGTCQKCKEKDGKNKWN